MCPTDKRSFGRVVWLCRCDCGNEVEVSAHSLRNGNTKSCGCLNRELSSERATTRNGVTKRYPAYLHQAWRDRRRWCYNPKSHNYHNYGGRGIKMCRRWKNNPEAWCEDILKIIGPRPSGLTLDRYPNNNRGYYPGNIRWATRSEQQRNRRKRKDVLV